MRKRNPHPRHERRREREPRLLLSVVIPIAAAAAAASASASADSRSTCERDDDAHIENVLSDAHEDSECTEEERVAVEQLAELRRIRDLSLQEDANDCSCSTEGSFNTYDNKLPSLLAAPSYTCTNKCDPSTSPDASTSAACRVHLWKQERQKSKLKQGVQDDFDQDNTQVATSKHATMIPDHNLESDNDGCLKSRRRLLSDIYGDHSNKSTTFLQPIKASKKRRKAISKIMAGG